jgi:hypothetical protein
VDKCDYGKVQHSLRRLFGEVPNTFAQFFASWPEPTCNMEVKASMEADFRALRRTRCCRSLT